ISRPLKIELWDESHLLSLLAPLGALHAGLRNYWFNDTVFTDAWFRDMFAVTRADLSERYLPDDHVDVEAQDALDILTRGERWRISVEAFLASFEPIKKQFANLHPWERFFGSPDIWASAHANLEYLERLART